MAGKLPPPTRRSVRPRKQQTRLQFSPLPSSSPTRNRHTKAVQEASADIHDDEVPSPVNHEGRDLLQGVDGSLPTPDPSSQVLMERNEKSSSPAKENQPCIAPQPSSHATEDEDEDEDPILTQRLAKRRRVNAQVPVRRSNRLNHPVSESEPQHPTSTRTCSPNRGIGFSNIGSPETSGDEDEVFMPNVPTQRRRRKETRPHQATTRTKPIKDHFLADDDEVDFMTSEDEQPRARKLSSRERHPKKARHRTRDEQEELDADLEDLLDSGNENIEQTSRTRGGPVTTKRDQAREHLALLKRRRAGEKIPRILDSDDDEEEEDEAEQGQDINLIGQPAPFASDWDPAPGLWLDEEDEAGGEGEDGQDEDDDRFIEDDDMTGSGWRPHPDIPIEFTQFASAKPAELFVHVVEWLVKNKLSPGFARHDSLYRLAMDRVDDQIKAQAGSRLISSAWNATFKYTILARPNISIHIISGVDSYLPRPCDACNKSNRPASYDFVLTGSPYSRDTLEPVNESDSEDDDDEASQDEASQDEAGHALAAQAQHFYLGSHCAANAQMGHKLTHWKYHLNEAVMQHLEEQQLLLAEAIVARDGMSHKKREKEADAVVDGMQATGKIAELWKELQNDLDDARLGMEDYQKKGGRSQGMIGIISSKGPDGIRREWKDSRYTETVELIDSDEG